MASLPRSLLYALPSVMAGCIAALGLAAPIGLAGCGAPAECVGNTTLKTAADGTASCVPTIAPAGACDTDAGARLVGGECQGDPSQFPTCGAGTILDEASNSCVPSGSGEADCVAAACGSREKDDTHFCISGSIRYLKDDACTAGKIFQVQYYDQPLNLLADPNTPPTLTVMTDAHGNFKLPMLSDLNTGSGLVAIGVIDPADGTGKHAYVLGGAGLQKVTAGVGYSLDVFAVLATSVAAWDTQVGFVGADTFEAHGAYVGRYYSADGKTKIPGVTMTPGTTGVDTFYFRGADLSTVDKTAKVTDATGAAIERAPKLLMSFSGTGGGLTWNLAPGGSAPGVVFVQKILAK